MAVEDLDQTAPITRKQHPCAIAEMGGPGLAIADLLQAPAPVEIEFKDPPVVRDVERATPRYWRQSQFAQPRDFPHEFAAVYIED